MSMNHCWLLTWTDKDSILVCFYIFYLLNNLWRFSTRAREKLKVFQIVVEYSFGYETRIAAVISATFPPNKLGHHARERWPNIHLQSLRWEGSPSSPRRVPEPIPAEYESPIAAILLTTAASWRLRSLRGFALDEKGTLTAKVADSSESTKKWFMRKIGGGLKWKIVCWHNQSAASKQYIRIGDKVSCLLDTRQWTLQLVQRP